MSIILNILKSVCFGFGTGFAISIPPGPAAIEAVNRSVANGARAGLKVSLGAVLGDFTLVIIVNLGLLKFLINNPTSEGIFWIFSGFLLLTFAYLNSKGNGESKLLLKISSNPKLGGVFVGFLMTLLNPTSISLWMAVSSTIFTLWLDKGIFYFLCSISTMFIGSFTWFVILNLFSSRGFKLLKKDVSKNTSKLLTIVLVIISIAFVVLGTLKFFT